MHKRLLIILGLLIFPAMMAYGDTWSLTKKPCIEKSISMPDHIERNTVRYTCWDENTVKTENNKCASKTYDRRGRLVSVFGMCKEGKDGITQKTYDKNGTLRSELIYPLDDSTNTIQKRYSKDGQLVEELFFKTNRGYPEPIKAKYYDQNGNFSHKEKDTKKLIKIIYKRTFDGTVETNIKTMSLVTELYAEKHGGQYPLSVPEKKYERISKCGENAYGYQYQCTNTIDGYEYTATAVDKDSDGKIKVFTIKTGEIFTEMEL